MKIIDFMYADKYIKGRGGIIMKVDYIVAEIGSTTTLVTAFNVT